MCIWKLPRHTDQGFLAPDQALIGRSQILPVDAFRHRDAIHDRQPCREEHVKVAAGVRHEISHLTEDTVSLYRLECRFQEQGQDLLRRRAVDLWYEINRSSYDRKPLSGMQQIIPLLSLIETRWVLDHRCILPPVLELLKQLVQNHMDVSCHQVPGRRLSMLPLESRELCLDVRGYLPQPYRDEEDGHFA